MRVSAQLGRATVSPAQRAVQCRFGGPGGGDGGRQQPPKLIIPGNNNSSPRPGGGGSLYIPGAPGGSPGAPGGGGASLDAPVSFRNYRPPPGFMDTEGAAETENSLTPQEMLNRLQAQAGHWHELAKLLRALQVKGFDAFAVEEATGLERKEQNLWISSASIYDALKKAGELSPEVLEFFDIPGSEVLLHELRFLSLKQRTAAVTYIAENGLNDAECTMLARAIKEHERRSGQRDGFSDSPADCLAYKQYRDALECRKPEAAEACANKGLALVESEGGRKRLRAILTSEDEPQAVGTSVEAILSVLRLEKDEVGCRPIALAGKLTEARAEDVRKAPKVSSEGPFATFTVCDVGAKWSWVPLPAWAIVSLAGRPVAFDVANCADLPALRATVRVKSDDDLRKLQGPGLLVIDSQPSTPGPVNEGTYYMVATADGGVDLCDGGSVGTEKEILGPVLFLCRPPARDMVGQGTAELLSL